MSPGHVLQSGSSDWSWRRQHVIVLVVISSPCVGPPWEELGWQDEELSWQQFVSFQIFSSFHLIPWIHSFERLHWNSWNRSTVPVPLSPLISHNPSHWGKQMMLFSSRIFIGVNTCACFSLHHLLGSSPPFRWLLHGNQHRLEPRC